MILSEREIKNFIRIKKLLKFERYKILLSLIMILASIFFHIFLDKSEITLSILALLLLTEILFSQKSKELVAMYEKVLISDSRNITLNSKVR